MPRPAPKRPAPPAPRRPRATDPAIRAIASAAVDFRDWRKSPLRAPALEAIASALDARRDEVIAACATETALFPAELAAEFDRLTGTLRLFAAMVREGSWVRASIDRAWSPGSAAAAPIGPGHDVRSMLVPLGPVGVFGASNFPLAYGVLGGDTASALAAGCTVVVKEHPAHPRTGRLLFQIASAALRAAGAGAGVLEYVQSEDPTDFTAARSLVTAAPIRAVGFTGSLTAGTALADLARGRSTRPIPVFAEMGSINPVRITPRSLSRRGAEIADALASSILLRHGQQCTKPGVIFVQPGRGLAAFVDRLTERLAGAPPRDMLAPWVRDRFADGLARARDVRGVKTLVKGGATASPRGARAALLHVKAKGEVPPALLEEIFGPAAIIIELPEFDHPLRPYPGALTWTLFAEHDEPPRPWSGRHEAGELADCAGRVVFNGVPTGVRVAGGMVHGGPWPATNRPEATAVGPAAVERWCRPVCWQNAPDWALPEDLRDANPRGLWRRVDGRWTNGPI